MLSFGAIAFATPWVLAALVVLPALLWLLRVTPPAPRRVRFPALELLRGIDRREETPARTPWWLMALRVLAAAMLIVALAMPLVNPNAALTGDGPVVLVVDNGWASARDWPSRRAAMEDLVARAERARRTMILVPTALPPGGDRIVATPALPANEARRSVQALMPLPWPTDRVAAAAVVREIGGVRPALGIWVADGLDGPGVTELATALQRLGSAEILSENADARPVHLLKPPVSDGKALVARIQRSQIGLPEPLTVRMAAGDGRLLARETITFAASDAARDVRFSLPNELRNEATAIRIEGETTAGATVLLDERWRRRPVGLVSDRLGGGDQPLLSDIHYLSRALEPYNELRQGTLPELLDSGVAAIVLPDMGSLSIDEQDALDRWVRRGGVLVRFAGPRMAAGSDGLLPVRLRFGDRALGGSMSWAEPARLSPFGPNSPFSGLAIPGDVLIQRQVLSEPTLDLAERTWARLTDGTPLVTSEQRESGYLVLVHTTAGPEWSNLALSGLYVEMLQRLVALSAGVAGGDRTGTLDPIEVLDGYGHLVTAPPTAMPLTVAGTAPPRVTERNPPGIYGKGDIRYAVNLGAYLSSVEEMRPPPSGVLRHGFGTASELALGPPLLGAALMLLALDLLIALGLRGLLIRRRAAVGAGLSVLLVLAAGGLADPPPARALDADAAIAATASTHLGFIRSGDARVDTTTRAGLTGLADMLALRTAVEPGVTGPLDPETDELAFFPLLYWAVTPGQPALSPIARGRLNAYMRNGGVILFDTRDQRGGLPSDTGSAALRALTNGLDIPPLMPVPSEHVLTRSFYLLQEFPGRTVGGKVWVAAREDGTNDGVSPVVIGGHDWAAAWAVDKRGLPLSAVVPGGERQREMAYRFGINLVMYALTGNYKADQVHVPAILERLGQ